MSDYLLIFFSAALVNNVVLVKFLGVCPLFGVSNRLETAVSMGLATTAVLTLSATCNYVIYEYFLQPLGLEFLRTLAFILVITTIAQITEMLIRHKNLLLHQTLGIFLPLLTANCLTLGVSLLSTRENYHLMATICYSFGAGIGFSLILVLFVGLRERLATADIPSAFQGSPILLMTAGILSMAFMGFIGLIKL